VVDLEAAEAIRVELVSGKSGGGDGPAAAVGTGWATLKGSFRLEEGASYRQRRPLDVNKDIGVCKPGGKPVLDQAMLVGDNRGIANVVVFLRKASRVNDSAKPQQDTVVFDQKECVFLSHVFPIQVGQKVDIKNSDPIGHNTNIVANKGVAFNQTIPKNESVTYSPTAEESLPVSVNCSIHPWMQAYMIPRDNGYVAISRPDGSFVIPDLPAGEELEFQVWHENAAGPGGALEAKSDWRRGRFKLKLTKDQDQVLDIVAPGSAFKG
jgi:plastocyanin